MKKANNNLIKRDSADALSRAIFSHDADKGSVDDMGVKSTETKLLITSTGNTGLTKDSKLISLPLVIILLAFISYLVGYTTSVTEPQKSLPVEGAFASVSGGIVDVELEARAVYVYDIVNDKPLFAKNEHEVLPLASLTKLMAVVTASEALPSDTVITVYAEDILSEGDTGLRVGERWKLADIISFTLITSSNDAASALAAAAGSFGQHEYDVLSRQARGDFIKKMNDKAGELGLRGTHFFNETGLDMDQAVSGGYGTVQDVTKLMTHALRVLYPDIGVTAFPRTTITSLTNILHVTENTNSSLGSIPNLIASKTGYTDLAGGNLVIAFNAGISRPIIITVLGSTREGRFKDAEALAWAALEGLTEK